jgi:hypothetical protein
MDYGDFFGDTWKVFSNYPVIHLRDYDGRKVSFASHLIIFTRVDFLIACMYFKYLQHVPYSTLPMLFYVDMLNSCA